MKIPQWLSQWFKNKNWTIHAFQKSMFDAWRKRSSTLLIVPTGGGKTLAGFMPSLVDIHQYPPQGLHTLYISPLKALAYDIERNLLKPIEEMGLNIKIESRTGDTTSLKRSRQRKKPPHILLTTPESLFLMLSHPNSADYFKNLQVVIVDELHALAFDKRGDLTALALAQLRKHALLPLIQFGLSATIANPEKIAQWINASNIIRATSRIKPEIEILQTSENIPYRGYLARYAVHAIYQACRRYPLTIVFVNTRAQAEFIFRQLWDINEDHFSIAIYHGSLDKQVRAKTLELITANRIKIIIATSALELGVDWGNVECVIQVGAPKGISRLLQRIGRSNHQYNKASKAFLVPANCFEAVECVAAIDAIKKNQLDGQEMLSGALDVVIQFIINSACSSKITEEVIYQITTSAYPYRSLPREQFIQLFQFAIDGGYVLKHYERYQRLKKINDKEYEIFSSMVARRHRQNIGTISEAARLRVRRIHGRGGKILGDIEEKFAQQLIAGNTFLFNGEVLEFIRIRDMYVEARRTRSKMAKIPSYTGGSMPLSTWLAYSVRELLNDQSRWKFLPKRVEEWLQLQKKYSILPSVVSILIETFLWQKNYYLVIHGFQGKKAHHTLSVLLSQRMENLNLQPLTFSVTDYGLAIRSLKPIKNEHLQDLLNPNALLDDLAHWLQSSVAIKRAFRQVAMISGLTEKKYYGQSKSMKQVTFSTDLIYDVLLKYEPQHILLEISKNEVQKELLDITRLKNLLASLDKKWVFNQLDMPSPLSIPILLSLKSELVAQSAIDEILENITLDDISDDLMDNIRKTVR